MAGVAPVNPSFQFFDAVGNPLADGLVDVYLAGTTTRTDTWQDVGQLTLNQNPIELDAEGRCSIILDGSLTYKWVVNNSLSVPQFTVDNIAGAGSQSASFSADLANKTLNTKGGALVGHNGGLSYTAGSLGAAVNDTALNVKMHPWLAAGDGTTDDYAAVQAALTAAAGRTLVFTEGEYKMTGGTPVIPSGTTVVFMPGAVLVQPNKGHFAGFAIAPGSTNITISGADIRGPWYGTGPGEWADRVTPGLPDGGTLVSGDTWVDHMAENIGIDVRGRWYQREILAYNAAQMGALTDFNVNIRIEKCRIDGFGQSGIFADNITNFWADDNRIFNCGRDGLRMYGCVRVDVEKNTIDNMAPGKDGAYPNWNVYGITATRMFGTSGVPDPSSSIGRPSERVNIIRNKVSRCHTWKGIDTHGGINIKISENDILNCYIGIGGDQAGINATHGINPVRGLLIEGNDFEFSGGQYMRAAVTVFGHDATTQAITDVRIVGNRMTGYGGNDIDGAIAVSNCRRLVIAENTIKSPPRSAICLDNTVEDVAITANVINDPRSYVSVVANALGAGYTTADCNVSGGGGTGLVVIPHIVGGQITSYGIENPGTGYTSAPTVTVTGDGAGATTTVSFNVGFGIIVQTDKASGVAASNIIRNETQASLRCISRTAPAASYTGLRVEESNQFHGSGIIKVYPDINTGGGGSFGMAPWAWGRFDSAGAFVAGVGISASASKTGTGAYTVTFLNALNNVNDGAPVASIYAGTGDQPTAAMASTTTLTVTTRDSAGVAADRAFTVVLWNDNP